MKTPKIGEIYQLNDDKRIYYVYSGIGHYRKFLLKLSNNKTKTLVLILQTKFEDEFENMFLKKYYKILLCGSEIVGFLETRSSDENFWTKIY